MKILQGNSYCRLIDAGADVVDFVDDYLTFETGGFVQRRGSRPKYVTQEHCLFERKLGKFPGGLTTMVQRALKDEGLGEPGIELKARAPAQPNWSADVPWVDFKDEERDYTFQRDALRTAVKRRRGILHIPTGGGKTQVWSALARVLDCRHLFVVNEKALVYQAAKRYTKLTGEEVGIVGDGNRQTDHRVVCATFQTLSKALKERAHWAIEFLKSIECLTVDECHTLPADTFYSVVQYCRGAFYRYGVSGTPLARGDKKSLFAIAALGPIIYRVTPQALVDRGVLSMPDIRFIACDQGAVAEECSNWRSVYSSCVTKSKKRNALLVNIAKRATYPAILFVKEISHGKEMMKLLRREKVAAEFVWGEKDIATRDAAIGRLEEGQIDVIIANVVFETGIDIPSLRTIIVGSAGKSAIKSVQRIGRGSRVTDDKTSFTVWDIADKGHPKLNDWTSARRRAYEREGYPVRTLDLE